jgi:CDP-glucose 4,6-dehydratase
MRVATGRAGNVIGGGDWGEDRLIPDIMRAAAAGTVIPIRRPDAIRPWQHVLEPLSGYLVLAERLAADASVARAWNFGPGPEDSWTVSEVLRALAGPVELRDAASQGGAEAPALRLDASLAREELGWAPRQDLKSALEATASWYRAVAEGADARAVSLEELRAR